MNNEPQSTSYQRERLVVIKLAVNSDILQHITVLWQQQYIISNSTNKWMKICLITIETLANYPPIVAWS